MTDFADFVLSLIRKARNGATLESRARFAPKIKIVAAGNRNTVRRLQKIEKRIRANSDIDVNALMKQLESDYLRAL